MGVQLIILDMSIKVLSIIHDKDAINHSREGNYYFKPE